jgi:hypothetical protein
VLHLRKKRGGGLGLPRLAILVPLAHLRVVKAISEVEDHVIKGTSNTILTLVL